jgi:NTP pyrophosphatase (non-canonical NTP hydrolase)
MGDGISDGLKDFPRQENADAADIERTLNRLSALCGRGAREKGFHQAFEDADFLESLAAGSEVDTLITQRLRDIAKRIRLLEVGTKLMLVVSELSEGFESVRDTGFDGHLNGEGNLGEEIADAIIRLGDLSYMVETPLGREVTDKMAVNKNRPYRHGRQA